MDMITPIKEVQISGKICYVEPWMTKGLESASHKKCELYKHMISYGSTESDKQAYIEYRNKFNRPKHKLMINFYADKCIAYQNNTKKLWQLINKAISKEKKKDSILSCITVDGIKQYTCKNIANEFGKIYSNIGKNVAAKIKKGERDIQVFLDKILRTQDSVILHGTTQHKIEKIVKNLPNKTSYGHDKINNVMLKHFNNALSYTLCIIFNQSIQLGEFPDLMKLAEVVPL